MSETMPDNRSRYVSDVISRRLSDEKAGRVSAGWHRLLAEMMGRYDLYLIAGRLVTFQQLEADEKTLFESLHSRLSIPEHCAAIYVPPSVVKNMMAAHPDGAAHVQPTKPSDAGALLVSRKSDFQVIVNAVLGLPPFMPAVDVYENGRMIAGYVYKTIEECVTELGGVMATHLGNRSTGNAP